MRQVQRRRYVAPGRRLPALPTQCLTNAVLTDDEKGEAVTYDQWKTTDPRELLPYDEEQEPMPQTFFQDFKTDNDEPVTVEYRYEDHGNCVVILEAWREPQDLGDVAVDVKLTDKEDERMCAWIAEHRHWSDHADSGDDYVR